MATVKDGRERPHPAKRGGYRASDWDDKRRLQVGTWFLSQCLKALPDVFELREYAIRARKPQKTISLRNNARETIHALRERLIFSSPLIAPSKESLNPWTGIKRFGFWHEQDPIAPSFVRSQYKETAREIANAFSNGGIKQHVAAVNGLQDVPFRINEPVLDALKKHGDKLVERGKLKLSKAALDEDIAVAENLRGTTFRIPINCDIRGRPCALAHFNFQREDHVRALFLFVRGGTSDENEHESLARHLIGRAGILPAVKRAGLVRAYKTG
jgi:DNA-directed RNA polymerase